MKECSDSIRLKDRWLVALAISSVYLAGCGNAGREGQLPTFAVRGVVKIDGQPSKRAMLQLAPTEASKGQPGASGMVADDGKFTLQTYAPGDGIPKGHYSVALGPDFGKFMPVPAVEPLVIEIKEANSSYEINFKSSGKASGGLPAPGMEKAQSQ
jgi:hypothetical protein